MKWKVPADIHQAGATALKKLGEIILEASNQQAPKDKGDLIASGKVVIDDLKVTIRYDAPYAQQQHEDMRLRHPGGRKAKFLQSALQDNTTLVATELANEIKEVLR